MSERVCVCFTAPCKIGEPKMFRRRLADTRQMYIKDAPCGQSEADSKLHRIRRIYSASDDLAAPGRISIGESPMNFVKDSLLKMLRY